MTPHPRRPDSTVNRRKRATARAHGWSRTADRSAKGGHNPASQRLRRRPPPGTALLMLIVVGMLAAVGVARVHMRTRVLEAGAEISELTTEHSDLLDRKRRLEAERAYLRHPDRIVEVARDDLSMVPVEPARVQRIELRPGVER